MSMRQYTIHTLRHLDARPALSIDGEFRTADHWCLQRRRDTTHVSESGLAAGQLCHLRCRTEPHRQLGDTYRCGDGAARTDRPLHSAYRAVPRAARPLAGELAQRLPAADAARAGDDLG